MQFLKSTLFPSIFKSKKNTKAKSNDKLVNELLVRVALLEEENKKSAEAIEEITKYISQVSVIITSLAGEMTAIASQVAVLVENEELGSLKAYLKSDDDGYIH